MQPTEPTTLTVREAVAQRLLVLSHVLMRESRRASRQFSQHNWQEAVEKYMGEKVDAVDVVEDAHVRGTYAIRATNKGHNYDFLYVGGYGLGKLNPDMLEEVEFKSWPPQTKKHSARKHAAISHEHIQSAQKELETAIKEAGRGEDMVKQIAMLFAGHVISVAVAHGKMPALSQLLLEVYDGEHDALAAFAEILHQELNKVKLGDLVHQPQELAKEIYRLIKIKPKYK